MPDRKRPIVWFLLILLKRRVLVSILIVLLIGPVLIVSWHQYQSDQRFEQFRQEVRDMGEGRGVGSLEPGSWLAVSHLEEYKNPWRYYDQLCRGGDPWELLITYLDLSFTDVTDEWVANVSRFKNLVGLDLSYTQISDAALEHVSNLQSLWTSPRMVGAQRRALSLTWIPCWSVFPPSRA